jgi:hypothetical protein
VDATFEERPHPGPYVLGLEDASLVFIGDAVSEELPHDRRQSVVPNLESVVEEPLLLFLRERARVLASGIHRVESVASDISGGIPMQSDAIDAVCKVAQGIRNGSESACIGLTAAGRQGLLICRLRQT